jgi:hypothetical protein
MITAITAVDLLHFLAVVFTTRVYLTTLVTLVSGGLLLRVRLVQILAGAGIYRMILSILIEFNTIKIKAFQSDALKTNSAIDYTDLLPAPGNRLRGLFVMAFFRLKSLLCRQ